MYQVVMVVPTPCNKVWWLFLRHVPSFNVTQLKINSYNFAQRHQKKDVPNYCKKNMICENVRVEAN